MTAQGGSFSPSLLLPPHPSQHHSWPPRAPSRLARGLGHRLHTAGNTFLEKHSEQNAVAPSGAARRGGKVSPVPGGHLEGLQ